MTAPSTTERPARAIVHLAVALFPSSFERDRAAEVLDEPDLDDDLAALVDKGWLHDLGDERYEASNALLALAERHEVEGLNKFELAYRGQEVGNDD